VTGRAGRDPSSKRRFLPNCLGGKNRGGSSGFTRLRRGQWVPGETPSRRTRGGGRDAGVFGEKEGGGHA